MNAPAHDASTDLGNYAAEATHIIDRIQSFGYLIAFSSDWTISHVSANCADLFARPVDDLVGHAGSTILSTAALHEVRSRLQIVGTPAAVDRMFGVDLIGDGRLFDIAVHASGRTFFLEAEPSADARKQTYLGIVRPMVDRLRQATSIEDLCAMAARQMRGLTGFDRVMIYRLGENGEGDGQVVAESLYGQTDSYLGRHFPASDIPAQIRRHYTQNMLRIIADVDDPTVAVIPGASHDGVPLDLTMSGLRADSPSDIAYLRNMGVRASMSVSIVRNGALWGLIACHHYAPMRLDSAVRTACELFAEFLSNLLEQAELRERDARHEMSLQLHDEIMARLVAGDGLSDAFDSFADSIGKVIPFDSIAGWIGGELVGRGTLPDASRFAELVHFLDTTGVRRVWHSANLESVYPPAAAFRAIASGVMALPVSCSPRDYIILFRKERAEAVTWAGSPRKAVEPGPGSARPSPGKTFAHWQERRAGHAQPWSDSEVAAAESLRVTLLEVVLRMTAAVADERARAQQRQDVIIGELNHRVRNLLNLVRSLISQSQSGTQSVNEFVKVVGDRIHALARAHDQVARVDNAPASVAALIVTECTAYVGGDPRRLMVTGTDALIDAGAFTTLALIFHELMTNSSKYGALSDACGHVAVTIARQSDGAIEIVWRDQGGPRVQPPRRRGFGSSIIEQLVPHELEGEAEIRYPVDGVVARFLIPARHIVAFAPLAANVAPPLPASTASGPALLSDDVMVVEDNMLIAMEAEDMLRGFGAANCHVASSVAGALAIAGRVPLQFALLDVNLGRETSAAIAEALEAAGVPFVVASGYGETGSASAVLGRAPAVTKPYTEAQLSAAISAAISCSHRERVGR